MSAQDGSVGPFPQAPAFGSPEAVAQAAETIRAATDGGDPWESRQRVAPSVGAVDGLWDLEGRYLEALDVLEEALAMIHKCASVKDICADDFPAGSVTGRGLATLRKAGRP